jgi:hypothetical protein
MIMGAVPAEGPDRHDHAAGVVGTAWLSREGRVRALAPDHGGQVMCALTALTCPAVTLAVAAPGWQPGRLAVTV